MEARNDMPSPAPVFPATSWARRLKRSVWVSLFLVAGVLSGCSLFGGDDDGGEENYCEENPEFCVEE